MKKILLTVFLLFAFVLSYSHPANDIKLSVVGDTLTLEITHPVSDTDKHYIDEVKISIDNKEKITQKISMQSDKNTFKLVYTLPEIKEGSVITVSAKCNRFGTKKAKLTVKRKTED